MFRLDKMNARKILYIVSILIVPTIAFAQSAKERQWQTIELGKTANLIVRLKLLSSATLADEHWIGFEFENTGSSDIYLRHVDYHINCTRYWLPAQQRSAWGSLGSGNDHDLFFEEREENPKSKIILSPGIHQVFTAVSNYASALLGLPPQEGFRLHLDVHLSIAYTEQQQRFHLSLQNQKGISEWHYPNTDDVGRMGAHVRYLLLNPHNRGNHAYILQTFLTLPSVITDLSVDDVLEGIQRRKYHPFNGRQTVLKFIGTHYRDSLPIISYFRDQLYENPRSMNDCYLVWNTGFIEPLLHIYEVHQKELSTQESLSLQALAILDYHYRDWVDTPRISQRLSNGLIEQFGYILKRSPFLLRFTGKFGFRHWAMYAQFLGHTHDKAVIPLLQPYLNVKISIKHVSLEEPAPRRIGGHYADTAVTVFPALRVCDVALHGILKIIDGDLEQSYKDAGHDYYTWSSFSNKKYVAEITRLRDKMIKALHKRLEKDSI